MTWRGTDGRCDTGSGLPGCAARGRLLGRRGCFSFCMASASHQTQFTLGRRARRTLFLLFAFALPAYLVSPYLAVPFMVVVIVTIASARSSGRTRADDG